MHRLLDPSVSNEVPPNLCALGVMTKAPRAGAVKTRLQPPLTPDEAAALNVCFLRDTADAILCAGPHAVGIAVYTPVGSEKDYSEILPPQFYLLAQRGDDFGQRLTHAVEDMLRIGFAACCLINSDSPTVTAEAFRMAVEKLRASDSVVLGPSDDGGYYLIGVRGLHRRLFEEIDWSTERVFAQTVERAAELHLPVETLPMFYDIDEPATLSRLCNELLAQNSDSAPATKAFLQELIQHEGRERIWPR